MVDDGSEDNTGIVIRENYHSVRYLRKCHCGVSAARNSGIHVSPGEWITFLDSDDVWLPTKLEAQFQALASNPDYRVIHTDEIWIRNGRQLNPKKKHRKHGGKIFLNCLALCCISPSSVLIHRSVFTKVGGFDEDLPVCEDYELWLRICARYPVLFVDQPLIVKYGGHAGQLSCTHWGMDRFRIQALEKIIGGGSLSSGDRAAAIATLLKKIEIYLNGARKRNRAAEVKRYEALSARYQHEAQWQVGKESRP